MFGISNGKDLTKIDETEKSLSGASAGNKQPANANNTNSQDSHDAPDEAVLALFASLVTDGNIMNSSDFINGLTSLEPYITPLKEIEDMARQRAMQNQSQHRLGDTQEDLKGTKIKY